MSSTDPPPPPPLPAVMVARAVPPWPVPAVPVKTREQRIADRKREWRRTRSAQQLAVIRARDADRKRAVREAMTPEQKRLEREKDARRKVAKRKKDKEQRTQAQAMSITRILNPDA